MQSVPENVKVLFEKFALLASESGHKQYSARTIIERIRWHTNIETDDPDFKCNNNWVPPLSRWFLERHPELPNFFEIRNSPKSKGEIECH